MRIVNKERTKLVKGAGNEDSEQSMPEYIQHSPTSVLTIHDFLDARVHPFSVKKTDFTSTGYLKSDRLSTYNRERDEDEESVTSYAPSVHSIIDDVPRTPKKPLSILDPRNNSPITEAIFVSIGLAAIAGASYTVYRIMSRPN